ncbi:MAG TPA: hypothetical protein VKH37_06490 [Ferruginibacter sp.]|nr:hypothetical protein [Ferruginibacter sp.]
MDTKDKIQMMEKMSRELDDILNSQTALLKKISQLEAENLNMGNKLLEERLPDVHEKVDEGITEIKAVIEEFAEAKDKFIAENPVEENPS